MKYFGTDGFRGEANVTLNVEHAYKVGRFLGNYFQKEDHKVRVVIGKDTRLSDRKSTRLNSSHRHTSRMPSSA